jgi:hypothetical protein
MSGLPMLIVDFDGVISPYGTEPADGMALVRVGGYRLLYRPEVIAGLNDLHRQGTAQLRWLTSWGEGARSDVAPVLGLVDFPVLGELTSTNGRRAWTKLSVVERNVVPGTRFAWIDDDLTQAQQRRVAQRYGAEHSLLIRPDPGVGLKASQLNEVRTFLA